LARADVSVVDLAPADLHARLGSRVQLSLARADVRARAALQPRLGKCRHAYGAAKLGALAPVLFTLTSAWSRSPVVHGCCRLGAFWRQCRTVVNLAPADLHALGCAADLAPTDVSVVLS